jgi:hypothetical protein
VALELVAREHGARPPQLEVRILCSELSREPLVLVVHGVSGLQEGPCSACPAGPVAGAGRGRLGEQSGGTGPSRPPACIAWTRRGASAARILPRPINSDWTGSRKHHKPGRTALGPPYWTRSSDSGSADPGPATARPRRALALRGPSRGPVTQTGPGPTTPPGCTSRARADLTTPVKCNTQGKRYPTKSTTRDPQPTPACHRQARRSTRCTDSHADRRPGLGRAPVTPHRSCTPRARRELQRSHPLEHHHSGCTGATAASGDSDTPTWGRTHETRQLGWPAKTGSQTQRTGHGPRNKKP